MDYNLKKKFFNEMEEHEHLDKRYGKKGLSIIEIKVTLFYLLNQFMKYSFKNNIKPILMHGGLIGYFFNNQILPWDDDLDLIICDKESKKNLKNENFDNYIIEVNPNCNIYSIDDKLNKISARVISKINGVFIDITYFIEDINKKVLFCKDKHIYKIEDIYYDVQKKKLKIGLFHNIPIYIPNNIGNCLVKEYGKNVLKPYYKNYIFNSKNKTWYKKNKLYRFLLK